MNIKKRILALTLVVITLLSLSGCSLLLRIASNIVVGDLAATDNRDKIVEFSKMDYERPDIDKLSELADDVRKLVDKGKVNNRLFEAINDFYECYSNYLTMSNIALIRSNADTSDDYYADEDAWCSGKSGEVQRILDDLLRYCANSDICDELDEEYFDGYLEENYADDSSLEYTDRIVELYAEESRLLSDYYALSVEMMSVDISDTDTWDGFNNDAAEIYIDLIKVRRELADEFGYDSYFDMEYETFGREYSADDLASYTAAIKKYMKPLYADAIDSGAVYSMYDLGSMAPERAFRKAKQCIVSLDPDLGDIMSYMEEYELFDISYDRNKIQNSYTVYLYDYDSPYLFVCPGKSKSDILTIAHEFGHFCDEYFNYNAGYSLDTAEMLSQGMEYMLISHLEDDRLRAELTDYKLIDELTLYIEQGCYSEFEHRAYELPDDELTVDNLNALFAEVADDYGFTLAYYEEYLNYIWIQISHMFEYPFYIISYCVSDSAAFNIYRKELEESGEGLEIYMDMIRDSASADFLDLIDEHDLPSPISGKTVRNIADTIREQLNIA